MTTTVRLLAGVAAVAMLLVACAPATTTAPDEQPHTIVIEEERAAEPGGAEPTPTTEEAPRDQGAQEPPSSPSPAPTEDGDTAGGAAPDDPDPEPQPEPDPAAVVADDRGPLGSACRAYLRGDVPALTIEVLHQTGARPSDGALDHLVASLEPVLDKPDGIDVAGPRQIPGEGRSWELDELRRLAAEHRQAHSSRSRAGLLVLSVAGEFEDPGVLGLAMSATEIVLFPQQIGDLATTLLGGSARIERSVLLHEAGHLLCLVNIGYTSPRDHEDPDKPHHSRHRDSVMYWAVPNDAVTQVFAGPPPDRFHPDDLADLADLREGRL